jgi:hypothetical protein
VILTGGGTKKRQDNDIARLRCSADLRHQ